MKANPEVKQYHLQVKTELEALKDVLHWFEGLVFPLLPQKTDSKRFETSKTPKQMFVCVKYRNARRRMPPQKKIPTLY